MAKEIKVIGRNNITWNARQVVKMMESEKIRFDNARQRTLVWTVQQKSLLIHSMILGLPINYIYAVKVNGVYDCLDGKQRCNAIRDFIRGQFQLTDVPPVEYSDGSTEDINGMFFSGLSEDMQDCITSYSMTIHFFEGISEEEEDEIFYRLNAGSALKAIEKSRVKCKALPQIQVVTKHPVFDGLSEKARARYADEDTVIKCFAMLDMDEPCLDTKAIHPYMESLEIDAKKRKEMMSILSDIKKMHDQMEKDENFKVAKKIYSKTHLVSLVPFVKEHGVQTEFVTKFFTGSPSMNMKYNNNATAGVGHIPSVKARQEALAEEFEKFSK